jgi:hypothetical protein
MVKTGASYQPELIELMKTALDKAASILPVAEQTSAMKAKLASRIRSLRGGAWCNAVERSRADGIRGSRTILCTVTAPQAAGGESRGGRRPPELCSPDPSETSGGKAPPSEPE